MRIGAKEGLSEQAAERLDEQAPINRHAESRALVVLEAEPVRERPTPHRQSAFLAHLIATREQHPQTRARRRAEPNEALRAYRIVAGLMK